MSVTISATDVKKLRDMTGAGMMDCKQALTESGGDFEKAIEGLRKKGEKLSAKRADREATEGAVLAAVSADRKKGVIVKLSCETDFVAKNVDFVALAKKIADVALQHLPASKEDLLNLPLEGSLTIGAKVVEQVGIIGEKVEVADYQFLEAEQVCPYIHMGNRAAVIVALSSSNADCYDAGRDVAMQVAAMKPIAVNKDSVDASLVEKEIEIGKEIARNEGKPEEMLEKIALGKLNKFFKEMTLLNQQFVKDNSLTVEQYLQKIEKGLTVTAFKHVTLG
jgi:elongation factor Ts